MLSSSSSVGSNLLISSSIEYGSLDGGSRAHYNNMTVHIMTGVCGIMYSAGYSVQNNHGRLLTVFSTILLSHNTGHITIMVLSK